MFGSLNSSQSQQQPAGGGLFGNNNTNNNTGGGLFGQQAKPAAPAPSAPSTGLFGNKPATTTPTPLFGGANNASQPAQPATGGLFGNKPATQPSTGLFGSNTTPAASTTGGAAPSAPSGGLFGNQNSGGSLFGNSNSAQPSSTGGLFGTKPAASTTQPTPPQPMFGAQQTQQAPSNGMPVITPFTRPTDLPLDFQKDLENTDLYIRQQTQLSEDLDRRINDHRKEVTSVPRDVQLLRFKLSCANEILKFDDDKLAHLKKLVEKDYGDVELLSNVTNEPRKYDRLLPYFQNAVECEEKLTLLSAAMRDVQRVISAEEFGKRATYDKQGIDALPSAIREEYMYFMSLSDRVAELHRHIEEKDEVETFEDMMG